MAIQDHMILQLITNRMAINVPATSDNVILTTICNVYALQY